MFLNVFYSQFNVFNIYDMGVTSFVALNFDRVVEISGIAESKLIGGPDAHVVDLVGGHVVQLALSDIWRQVCEVFPR